MRAYLIRMIRISRRSRLMVGMAVVSLLLVTGCPSAGRAISLAPELTSGFFRLERSPFGSGLAGGVSVSTPDGSAIQVGLIAPFAHGTAMGGVVSDEQIDIYNVAVTLAGQTYGRTCGPSFPTPTSPCTTFGLFSVMHADPPPFSGNPTVTVPGTFFLIFGASVLFAEPFPPRGFRAEGHLFQRSGPASLTFVWLPSVFFPGVSQPPVWQFESGFAQINPTPEPTTLLLFGTTAAGLGLARWVKRRRSHEHAE